MDRETLISPLPKISPNDGEDGLIQKTNVTESLFKEKLAELLEACRKNLKTFDEAMVTKALRLCYDAHKNDRRASGEPYFIHPFAVSMIVAQEIPLDDVSVACALLHDVVEDTAYSLEEIREEFGDEV